MCKRVLWQHDVNLQPPTNNDITPHPFRVVEYLQTEGAMSSFPLQANVILQGLVKMPDLNGKKGVVKGPLTNGRHQVYVEHMSKK